MMTTGYDWRSSTVRLGARWLAGDYYVDKEKFLLMGAKRSVQSPPVAWRVGFAIGVAGLTLGLCTRAFAANPPPSTQPVPIEFPADGIELRTLADIVTRRLKIPILYDETIQGKKVIIRVPVDVPESALLGVLQSALRMKQMTLVDAEQPGWKQIIPAANLAAVAGVPVPGGAAQAPGDTPVTEVMTLSNVESSRVVETVRPFLTQPGGNVQAVAGQKVLIVSDYPSVVDRMRRIVKMLDESMPIDIKFVQLKNAEATKITPVVEAIIQRMQAVRGEASGAMIAADDRLNQVLILAPPDRTKELGSIVEGMDRSGDVQTKVYRLKVFSPERLDRVVKNQLGAAAKSLYQSTPERESQSLVVTAAADVHGRIEAMINELDVPMPEAQSPIRMYKLKNTKAVDVLETIAALQGEGGLESFSGDTGGETEQPGAAAVAPPARPIIINPPPGGTVVTAPAQPPANAANPPAQPQPPPSDVAPPPVEMSRPESFIPAHRYPRGGRYGYTDQTYGAYDQFGTAMGGGAGGQMSVQTRNATVAADINTNSIIVIAQPGVQQIYEGLIKQLDERRPQVQIECTIVTLDTTDGYTFGVDIAAAGGSGSNQLISFSSFGVATVDPVNGTLTPVAAPGGTFALLNPGAANVVMRALAQNSRSRLVSAPQLLVNDNGKGTLKSQAEEPYAEILDTTNAARTTLGGRATAGTSITVEPSISEDDYMQLKYAIELSAFTGTASNGLPPPSQTNNVESRVTIPDGYTIVVGGLTVKNLRESQDSLPIIRNIPVINWVFGTRSKNTRDTTLFVFIRPVILRDDKFSDLKHISEKHAGRAGLPGDFPISEPIPIR